MTVAQSSESRPISLDLSGLGRLMPLHIALDPNGAIAHIGPTLERIVGSADVVGTPMEDIISVMRPRAVKTVDALIGLEGTRVKLRLDPVPDLVWTAMVIGRPAAGGAFLNLSFGPSILDAVARFDLTLYDFAPTDLTAELLFLMEAKSAAFRLSTELNNRLEGAKRKAQEQALTDTLTGLRNRRAMDRELYHLTHSSDREVFGLMHIDLDHFKAVNDTLGHAAGDHVLLRVAKVLQDETRRADLVCRVGGDEFVLVMRDCQDLRLLNRIAWRIIERLKQPILFEGKLCQISASIGTTVSNFYDDPKADEMLSDADDATYQSKNAGRATHTVFDLSMRRTRPSLH